MKKTLSVLFAVIFALSALVSASAIGLVNPDNLKSNVATYMGYDESKIQEFNYVKSTHNLLDYYTVTFKYDGVGYTVGVDAVGIYENFSYSAKKIIVPAVESKACISEASARGYALREAENTASADAIFKTEKFEKKNGVAYYSYDFLSKTAEWNVDVNAYTGAIINVSKTEKNAIVMIFIRLFAKLAALFAF